jgi:aryl-alcohol dehydrogenase-like predicted oxidoreductase
MSGSTRRDFLASAAALAAFSTGFTGCRSTPSDERTDVATTGGAAVERRKFGATDMSVTVLGFGGAEIGYQQVDHDVVATILNSALDAGLNVIDTAECYAGSEEAIGASVAHRRKDFHLFTKVGHMEPGDAGWTAASIERSIERSLGRLKTDHLDLVQLHSCGREILERGECIAALEKAKKAGKARYIGYSGDGAAAVYAIETGRFDTLQTSINIVDQECIDLTIPKAKARNMGIIAKRPIANAVWRYDTQPDNGYVVDYWKRLQALDYDFTKAATRDDAGPDGAAGTALRFTLSIPGVHVAIVGTTKPERWKQNAELLAKGGALPRARFDAIRARWKSVASADWTGRT